MTLPFASCRDLTAQDTKDAKDAGLNHRAHRGVQRAAGSEPVSDTPPAEAGRFWLIASYVGPCRGATTMNRRYLEPQADHGRQRGDLPPWKTPRPFYPATVCLPEPAECSVGKVRKAHEQSIRLQADVSSGEGPCIPRRKPGAFWPIFCKRGVALDVRRLYGSSLSLAPKRVVIWPTPKGMGYTDEAANAAA